jgi:hypothetical protein
MEIGYMVGDAKKRAVDPERDASGFNVKKAEKLGGFEYREVPSPLAECAKTRLYARCLRVSGSL